jgi:hypothetical protein
MRDAHAADVIGILKAQHAEIRRAFARAAMPGRERPAAFRQLVRLLSVHEAAEEAHVHPTTRHIGSVAQAARARLEEERRTKRLLVVLDQAGPDSDGYLRALRALRRAVLSHAAREERDEFPALAGLSRFRRWVLGQEVRLARYLAPTRPHPRVNGMLGNRIAMLAFGPADRCRDFAERWSRRNGCRRAGLYIAIRGTRLSEFPDKLPGRDNERPWCHHTVPVGDRGLSHGQLVRRRPDTPRTRR